MNFFKRSILIFIGLVFVGWGSNLAYADIAPDVAPTPFNKVVAIVNSEVVTQQELNDATSETINQAKAQNQALPSTLIVTQHVLQTLIMQKIALQLAKLNNITASDAEVQQTISKIASQNQLTVAALYAKLATQGISQSFYLDSIRTQLTIQKLEQAEIANAIIITPSQIDSYMAAAARVQNANAEYEVAHILIALPTDPDANDYADAKAKALMVLQKIKDGMPFSQAAMTYSGSSDAATGGDLGYESVNQLPVAFIQPVTSMKVGDVVGPIPTDGGFSLLTLLNVKGTTPITAHYVTEYHVESILIKTSPLLSNDAAKAQLQRITQALQNGKSFAEMAKAYSEDYFTNQNGGDMGFINPVKLNPILASYIQTAPLNQLSPPIQTPEGWYLIEVLGTRQVDDTEAYQRQQAQQALFQQKAGEAIQAWQAQIKAMSYIKILDPTLVPPGEDDSGS